MKLKNITMLFLIMLIVFTPVIVSSAQIPIYNNTLQKTGELIYSSTLGEVFSAISDGLSIGGWALDKIGWSFVSGINFIFHLLSAFIIGTLFNLSSSFLEWSVNPGITNITGQPFVQSGVLITRSIANLMLIAILLIISISTIIGIESYGIKKTLPMLIAVALLINFSSVITGIVIDAGQVPLEFFVKNAFPPDFSIGNTFKHALHLNQITPNSFNLGVSGDSKTIAAGSKFIISLIQGGIGFFASLIFFKMGLLLLMRYVAFWILTIFAPLAFMLGILPSTKQYLWKWFHKLLNWSFLGAIVTFFIYLSLLILIAFDKSSASIFQNNLTFMNQFGTILITLFTVYFFLNYGYDIAKSMADKSAMAVVNGIQGILKGGAMLAGGIGLGAVALGAKALIPRAIGAFTRGKAGKAEGKSRYGAGMETMEKYGAKLRTHWATRYIGGKSVGNFMMNKEKLSDVQEKELYERAQAMKIELKDKSVNERDIYFKKLKTRISKLAFGMATVGDATGMSSDSANEISKYSHLMSDNFKKQFSERYGYLSKILKDGAIDETGLVNYIKTENIDVDKFDYTALKNKLNSIDKTGRLYKKAIGTISKYTSQNAMSKMSLFNQEGAMAIAGEANKVVTEINKQLKNNENENARNILKQYAIENEIKKSDGSLDIEETKRQLYILSRYDGMLGTRGKWKAKDLEDVEKEWKEI